MLNYAIVGFGGLGKRHFGNTKDLLERVGDVRLAALCDIDPNAFTTQTATNVTTGNANLDLSSYNLYENVDDLFENEKLDFIITALPTDIHEEIAVKAMERKINVFSEKPMAINLEQAQNMLDKAKENDVKLMIGQCVRYAPASQLLKELVENKKYGDVMYANFERFSGPPVWTWKKWMFDESRSGGVALDMHIHDIDLIHWLFGKPKSVTSRNTVKGPEHDCFTTIYDYGDMYITARSAWGFTESYTFRTGFTVKFEDATLEYSSGKITLYTDEGAEELDLPAPNNTLEEMVDFVNCIRNNCESKINTPESCKISVEIALAEKHSAKIKETVLIK